jgi:hypothetical protein
LNEFLITLDIDWAPDFVVDFVARELLARQVRATWFITHQSPTLDLLRAAPDLFELGLHPNFLPGSSHGNTPAEVLSHLTSIEPQALSMRSHSLAQSTPIFDAVLKETHVRVDSTIFLPNMDGIRPVEHLIRGNRLLRVPFFWADDYEMERRSPDWHLNSRLEITGLKVFLFHPIHLFLNSASFDSYAGLKKRTPQLQLLTEDFAQDYIHNGSGTLTLFRELVDHLATLGKSSCLRDIYRRWESEPLA